MRPFRALTYSSPDPAHLARVTSPAYDLVTAEGRDRLAGSDPHNIVRLILPQVDGAGRDRIGSGRREPACMGVAVRPHPARLGGATASSCGTTSRPCGSTSCNRPGTGRPRSAGWPPSASPDRARRPCCPTRTPSPPAVEGRRALLAATRTDLEPIVLAHDADAGGRDAHQRAVQAPPTLELPTTTACGTGSGGCPTRR